MRKAAVFFWCTVCTVAAARAAEAPTGNPGHNMLLAQSAAERAAILGKSVGNGCTGTSSFFMGIAEDRSALWSVLCADGNSYVVNVSPDPVATTKALQCSRLKTMNLDCFSPLPDALRKPTVEGSLQASTSEVSVPVPAAVPIAPTVLRGRNGR
jgi:hypothetical protein